MDTLFFIASKLAWSLLRPETWILLLVLGTLVALSRGRPRTATWLCGGATGLLFLGGILPLGAFLLHPLESRYPANPDVDRVAGIIVLGGGEVSELTDRWGQPQVNEAGDRFLAALSLARRFPQVPLLFTGGLGSLTNRAGTTGAEVARDLLLSAGLSPDRLIVEGVSRNTAENARNSLAMKPAGREGAWILVTSAFHMPRAIETFCAAGWTDLVPWPTDFRSGSFSQGIRWGIVENIGLLDVALKEYVGRLAYGLTGRAGGSEPDACRFQGGSGERP